MKLFFRAPAPSGARDREGWRQSIAAVAQAVLIENGEGMNEHGPVHIDAEFMLPRPKARRSDHHLTRPDPFVLSLALRDGLRSIVYRDEAQVTHFKVTKIYTDVEPCALVWVTS